MLPLLRRITNLAAGEPATQTVNWEEVVGSASFHIEAIATGKTTVENGSENEAKPPPDIGKEQLLNVRVIIDMPQGYGDNAAQTHLVLVVDRSGSMAGKPWSQVQSSLIDLIGRSLDVPSLKTDLIAYSNTADHVKFRADNYVQVINDMRANHCTNFKDAFMKVIESVKNAGPSYTRTIVVFMTDGCDTVNSANVMPSLITNLSETFTSISKDVCIHAVGFSREHNFDFLKKLAETGGATPGMFRYCEPGEDTESLQQKLDELFDFILQNTRQPATLHVSMSGEENYFITGNQKTNMVQLEGKQEEAEGKKNFTSETWIHVENFQHLPDFSVFVDMKIMDREIQVVTIPCICSKPEVKVIETADDKAAWHLRILTRNVEDLVTRIASAISNKKDVSHFQEKLEKYQRKISRTTVFGNGITKQGRETMFIVMKEIQSNLDKIQSMLAQYLRSGTESISLLARAHDMRYQAVFSKNRRQRVMDKRVTQNMKYAQEAQDSLASLKIDEQEVKGLSQEALEFYFCVLSQDSVCDVLLGDDKADTIGFGLAVKRSEVVLDEPTLIRVQVISGTLVSRNAMLDALEFKINISSHLRAHGGFSLKDAPLGVTTVGAGREPINSWLPLYITKSHWDRVKVILKPALGSFCTLDPLGYHYKQLDVLFAVLGSMIGQLTERNVGEHQLRLLFAVQRTCAACLQDFNLHENVKELVRNFVASPEGRTKDIIPNLYTLIGFIVSLPAGTAKEIFCIGEDANKLSAFWLGFITELIRRAAGTVYGSTSNPVLHGLLYSLLHGSDGNGSVPECEAVSQLIKLCCDPGIDDLDLQIPPFDPTAEVKVPTVTLKHDPKVDKAMEVWAQGKTGYIKNLSRNRKYKQATGAVQKWLKEISAGLVEDINKAVEVECLGNDPGKDGDDIEDEEVAVEGDDKPDDGTEGAVASGEANASKEETADGNQLETQERSNADEGQVETEERSNADEGQVETEERSNADEDQVETEEENKGNIVDGGKGENVEEVKDEAEEKKAEKPESGSQFDCQNVTGYMLKVMAQLLNKTCRATFPGVQSLPGCIAFVDNWLSRQHDITDIDTNSGLPPQAWIEEVRTAVVSVYRELRELEGTDDVQLVSSEASSQENTVVTVVGAISTATEAEEAVQQSCLASQKGTGIPEKDDHSDGNDDDDDNRSYMSDEDDDDDDDDDDSYDYEANSYMDESRRLEEKKNKKQGKRPRHQVLLPSILQYLAKDQDVMVLLRAMLCQAVRFHSNSSARGAITNKVLLDLQDSHEARVSTLRNFSRFLEEHIETIRKSLLERVVWQQANHCMLHATTTWAFIGYLMNTHKSRLEGFSDLVDLLLTTVDGDFTPPCLQEKVHILLTGKYEELPVLDNGNQWLPEKKMATKFKTLLGPEIWLAFEVELRSTVQIHVYRESDIPNRHGHCNSNPYIPNVLRAKLGMKMLPEPAGGRGRHRKR